MVTIEVGPERKQYVLHQNFLVYYSKYFEKAHDGRLAESENRMIPLHDVEPTVLNIFANWLYAQQVPAFEGWLSMAEEQSERNGYDTTGLLMVKAMVFGDRFMILDFYRQVHNQYVDTYYHIPPHYNIVIHAYGNLSAACPLLRFLVDCQYFNWNVTKDTERQLSLQDQLPKDFLLRIMRLHGNKLIEDKSSLCAYHIHEDDDDRACCAEFSPNRNINDNNSSISKETSKPGYDPASSSDSSSTSSDSSETDSDADTSSLSDASDSNSD